MQRYEVIEECIQSRDIEGLRVAIGNLCYNRFSFFDDFDDAISYVQSKGIDIKEDYNKEPLISEGKTTYTDDDFADAVFELKNNFCNERIEDVKKICKTRYGQSAPAAAEEKPREKGTKKGAADTNPKAAGHQERNPLLVAGIIAVLVIIVVAVMVVVNLLKN